MSFRFSLQPLLRVNSAQRTAQRTQLAAVQRSESVLREELGRIDQQLAAVQADSRHSIQAGPVDLVSLQNARQYARLLHQRRAQLVDQQQTLAEQDVRQRAALTEADRQVRLLERLSERQREAQGRGPDP
jgi:flagellar export protein FliJ